MEEVLNVALVGQPNCGKSTLFTAVSGYYVESGNFPGTTIHYTETKINYQGRKIRLIDLPGIYSISSHDLAEKVTRQHLLSHNIDVIVNVIDSTMLSRSLELTLQIIEMNLPVIVALNMMDEAEKKGIEIDVSRLEELLGVKAFPVVAVKGEGIADLFNSIVTFDLHNYRGIKPVYDRDVEECIKSIEERFTIGLNDKFNKIDRRFIIIRLLEMDEEFEGEIEKRDPLFLKFVIEKRKELADLHNWPEESVFASHRHAVVLDMFERIVTIKRRSGFNISEEIDRFLINPIGGLLSVTLVFGLIFFITFYLGDFLSSLLEEPIARIRESILRDIGGIWQILFSGLLDGISGGLGIVIPYFLPLILLLALLEDSGVLPRMAFMLDGIMHRFGLHGKSLIPFLLGYGCNVPAIMTARTLENQWDRRLVILLSTFIPCSARTVVILAIITKYLGWLSTLGLYLLDLAVIFTISSIIGRFRRSESEGFIMDVPPVRRPYLSVLTKKVWYRIGEFIIFAWPVIVLSSIVLSFMDHWGANTIINSLLSPLTEHILGLPPALGILLFLGIFRKELSLVMLYQVLGTEDVSPILSSSQLWVFTVFIVFYIPCIATISTTIKEAGYRLAIISILLNTLVAILIAGGFALVLP